MNVIGEVLYSLPVTSTQPLEKPRGLHRELCRLVKGESGIIDGEKLQNFVFFLYLVQTDFILWSPMRSSY